MRTKDLRRFTEKYIKAGVNGCWLWMNSQEGHGYGTFWLDGKKRRAHRVAYEHYVGPIPDGLDIDHLCRVRNCVNPDHLEPVTNAENIRRGNTGQHNAVKTHCPQGHPYSGDNLIIHSNGGRRCRTCKNEHDRRRYYARKAGPGGF